ncbi:Crp/Fnr family transcriptional regulator [Pedobacter nutrimenti]|uniref:Crp/Fnr family transcriptional regulator n=1 Tax=Pedobacter nutrimenti TaxID=1241337 RepID=UPI00292D2289|nr:cyclic nucleotide-binding domain-containing protein [Pedobacter nutrimenti]
MLVGRDIWNEELEGLFTFLAEFLEMPYREFKPHVSKQLAGCSCEKQEVIHWAGEVSRKCWYVAKGMVMIYVNGVDGKVVLGFFKAGEIAILPDSFKNGTVSVTGLIAVAETELLEISTRQMQLIYKLFPESRDLEGRIISYATSNLVLRGELLEMDVRSRVKRFHEIYPETMGKNRSVKLLDKDKANFLNIGETYICRFLGGKYDF